jgi:hypothetical protein
MNRLPIISSPHFANTVEDAAARTLRPSPLRNEMSASLASLPRSDAFSGRGVQRSLHKLASQSASRKPLTWQELIQQNPFFQHMQAPRGLSHGLTGSFKRLFSSKVRPVPPSPAKFQAGRSGLRQKVDFSSSTHKISPPKFETGSKPLAATPQDKQAIRNLFQQNFRESMRYEGLDEQWALTRTALDFRKSRPELAHVRKQDLKELVSQVVAESPELNGLRKPPVLTPQDKLAVRHFFQQSLEECRQYEGYDEASAISMAASRLRDSRAEFKYVPRAKLKQLVREALGVTKQSIAGSSAPIPSYSKPQIPISDRMSGSSVPVRPSQTVAPSPQTASARTPTVQTPAQTSANQTSPPRSLNEFLAKWQNVPLKSPTEKLQVAIAYHQNSDLGCVMHENKVARHAMNEPVSLSIPEGMTFAGPRQHALYANALILAHLHERRAKGYTFQYAEFGQHSVPPVPAHARDATQAMQLAEQILHGGNNNLDQFEEKLKKLNHGLGWEDRREIDSQLDEDWWNQLCRTDRAAKEDLMQLSESAVASSPALHQLHDRLHREQRASELRAERQEARKPLDLHLEKNLPVWEKAAAAAHPGNPAAVRTAIHRQLREAYASFLTGPLWQDNGMENALTRHLVKFDTRTARRQVEQHLPQWIAEARKKHGGDADEILNAIDEKILELCTGYLDGDIWKNPGGLPGMNNSAITHIADKIYYEVEDMATALLEKAAGRG